MEDESKLNELVLEWESLQRAGQTPSPEELCRDCPELLSEFREHIRILQSMNAVLDPEHVTPGTAPVAERSSSPQIDCNAGGNSSVTTRNDYRILAFHAKGALGEVLRAEDASLRRQVAIKRIQSPHDRDPNRRRRFLWEAEITSRLEHPGIVPVHGVGEDSDGRPCYTMRFVQGDSLDDAIKKFHDCGKGDVAQKTADPFSAAGERSLVLRQLLGRFVTVCNTIAYAHSQGVIHRDIKPANIMLGPYGETLVVDWGLAKLVGAAGPDSDLGDATLPYLPGSGSDMGTKTGSALGTPAFMSPEQAAGRVREIGPASDIYSLGATLYTLIAGQSPFQGGHVGQLLGRVERGSFPKPREVNRDTSPALEAICLKAMATLPEHRYATALDLANDIEHWLADEPVSAMPEPWSDRLRRWVSRHRTIVTTAAAAMVVAATTLGVASVLLNAARHEERKAKLFAQSKEAEAERERKTAEYERDEAARQKARAEESARRTRQAVDKYFTAVSESPELRASGLELLRQKLLGTAGEFYDSFVLEQSDAPDVKAEQGRAFARLASITQQVSGSERVLELYQKALTAFEELTESDASNPGLQIDQADCHNSMAAFLRATGKSKESEDAFGRAIEIRQNLASARPDLTENRNDLAASLNSLGLLQQSVNQREPAAAFRRGLDVAEQLVADEAADPAFRRTEAHLHNSLGLLHSFVEEYSDAEPHLNAARDILQSLVGSNADVAEFQRGLAGAHINLGNLYNNTHRLADAETSFRSAIEIYEQLADRHPAVLEYQRSLAGAHANLGNVVGDLNRLPEAEPEYLVAIKIHERLVRLHPNVTNFAIDLGRSQSNMGRYMFDTKRHDAALEWHDRAIRVLGEVVQKNASLAVVRRAMRNTYWNRAQVLIKLHRLDDADESLTQAIAFDDGTRRVQLRINQLDVLTRKNEHVAATSEATSLATQHADDSDLLYSLAALFAVASASAQQDSTRPQADQIKLADRYAAESIRLLRRTYELGRFKERAYIDQLRIDDDFATLRPREDFQRLLNALSGE